MWGVDPKKGIPSLQAIFERIHPEDRAIADQAFESAIRETNPVTFSNSLVRSWT